MRPPRLWKGFHPAVQPPGRWLGPGGVGGVGGERLGHTSLCLPLSLTRGNTTKTNPTSVPTATVPTRTRRRCRSTCRRTPSRTPRRTAVACAAGRTPQWVQARHTSDARLLAPALTCVPLIVQETYLMKHMSKHTVVEHLVTHQSPQRTESPSIPIRISLIWSPPPPLQLAARSESQPSSWSWSPWSPPPTQGWREHSVNWLPPSIPTTARLWRKKKNPSTAFLFFPFFLNFFFFCECNSTARCRPEGLRSEECLASRFNKHFGEHRVNLPDALATRNTLRFFCLFHEMGSKTCQMIFALILKTENEKACWVCSGNIQR